MSTLKFAAPLVEALEELRAIAEEVADELDEFDLEMDDEVALAREAVDGLFEDSDALTDLLEILKESPFNGLNRVEADDALLEDLEHLIEKLLQPVHQAAARLRASLVAAR